VKKTIVLRAVLALALSTTAPAATRLVPGEYPTIQDAIDACIDGDVVIVAPGTYTGPGNRDIDFLGKAITVRSTDPNDPNIVAATTIDCNGSEAELHCGFYFINNHDGNAVLAGLTITNGYARYGGGAIQCYDSNPTIANCKVTGNYGGGISCYNYIPGYATITNCTISGNLHGPGIETDRARIIDCLITDNTNCTGGRMGAGGIVAHDSNIINCLVSGNTNTNTYGAGGISVWDAAIVNCAIHANTSLEYGAGGIEAYGHLMIQDCLITGNTGSAGGAISLETHHQDVSTIVNCTIVGNSVAYGGGAIHAWGTEALLISNCILWQNHAPQGPEIFLDRFSNLYMTYSDVQGGQEDVYLGFHSTLDWGDGNIDTPPCVATPGYWADINDPNIVAEPNDPNAVWIDGDYHLPAGSPCINAGDPNFVAGPNDIDIDGEARVFAGRVDMGADEFMPSIECQMKFTPQTFNPCTKGLWAKAHCVLPPEFGLEDVDANSPLIIIEPLRIEAHDVNVFVNVEGVVEIHAAFDRSVFCSIPPGSQTITAIGSLTDGRNFYGADTIRIITGNLKCLADFASHWLQADCAAPDWCMASDINRDARVDFADFAMLDPWQ
jgi:hypothetical protein